MLPYTTHVINYSLLGALLLLEMVLNHFKRFPTVLDLG